jgi:SWI/SNF-related matrix-associated actin-dependent regulator of chromatin subfamily A member 5
MTEGTEMTLWYVLFGNISPWSRVAALHRCVINAPVTIFPFLANNQQEVDETPDYTDSEDPNTTASSVVGEPTVDGRRRRAEANQLRRSIFGKKHDKLGESQVREPSARFRAR